MANHVSHSALPYPIKNARFTLAVPYVTSAGVPTDPTTPDSEVSIDVAAFADCTEEVTTISGSNGFGYLTLTGAETNGSLVVLAAKVASGPNTTLATVMPRVLATVGSGTLSAGSAGGGTLGTLLAYDVTGCFIRTTGGTGGGGTGGANNQARKVVTYNTSTGAFTVAPNWETTPSTDTTYDVLLPEGVTLGMLRTLNPTTAGRTLVVDSAGLADSTTVKVGPTGAATAQTARDLAAVQVRASTAQAGAGTTITLDASASATNDLYKGMLILITGGTGAGQVRTITTYGGANKVATVDRAWATSPNNTSTFAVLAADNPSLTTALAVTAAVSKVVVFSGTAQTGSTSNTIKLSAAASATNNIYNGDLITLTGGTGVGQTRTVISYVGSTKVATVDRAWNTTPDNTSTFDIYASTTPSVFSDQGVAQASTATSITLAATASAVTNVYNGSLVTILSGTDAGDTAEITAYNGTTKVATTTPAWAVNPDTTSAYAVIPTVSGSGAVGGTQDVNVIAWGGTAVSTNVAGIPKVDVVDILGSASVGAAGYVGVDWGQVANKTTTNALTGTTIASTQQVDINTIKTQTITCAAAVTILASVGTAATNTAQTGDSYAIVNSGTFGNAAIKGYVDDIGVAGAGLTALGDTRIANLDATVSSRMATYTQPTGFLAATFPATVASTPNITGGTITTVTTLTNLPAITTDWLTAAGLAADAVTKIQSGLATPTNITAASGITLAANQHVIVDSGTVDANLISINGTTFSGVNAPVILADGVAHGGTPGSSTATLAFSRMVGQSQTANTPAFSMTGDGTATGGLFQGGASDGDGLHCAGGGDFGSGLIARAAGVDPSNYSQAASGLVGIAHGDGGIGGWFACELGVALDIVSLGGASHSIRIQSSSGGHDVFLAGSGDIWDSVNSRVLSATTAGSGLTQADVRTAVGLANPDLDTQLGGITTNVGTLLSRLGSFAGSGVNTVLGFFKALLSKAAATPSDVGGTFDPATDSVEALRDRGDAAWVTATGFSTLNAAGVRSAIGMASPDLDAQLAGIAAGGGAPTVGEISAQVSADLATAHGSGSWATAAGFAEPGDTMELDTATLTRIADVTLRRGMAAVEASLDGDTLTLHSLYGSIQQLQNSSVAGVTLTVKKTGNTTLGTLTITVSAGANPITGVS